MTHWCESCGQAVSSSHTPGDHAPATAIWLDEPGADTKPSFTKPGGSSKGSSGREKKLLSVVGAVVLLWAAFIGLGRLATPDDGIDEQVAAEMEQERLDRETRAEEERAAEAAELAAEEREAAIEQALEAQAAEFAEIAEVDGAYGAADAAPGFPSARLGRSVQVERLQRQLDRRSSQVIVAYNSAQGIVLVDMAAGSATIMVTDPDLSTALAGAELLRTGADTFAIDPQSLTVEQVGGGSSLIVTNAADGNTYFVDANSLAMPTSIIEVVSNGDYTFHRTPQGAFELQAVDGLGLLAVSKGPSGGTLLAGTESFSQLSDYSVLTGTDQALLEQACTDEGCSLVITDLESGERTDVPPNFVRFGDQYQLSPNGGSLLRHSREGFAEVLIVDTNAIAWVAGSGVRSPVWSPESDFVVWMDRLGVPEIKLMFTDERDWLAIDLVDLGAPPPIDDQIIVFAPR